MATEWQRNAQKNTFSILIHSERSDPRHPTWWCTVFSNKQAKARQNPLICVPDLSAWCQYLKIEHSPGLLKMLIMRSLIDVIVFRSNVLVSSVLCRAKKEKYQVRAKMSTNKNWEDIFPFHHPFFLLKTFKLNLQDFFLHNRLLFQNFYRIVIRNLN